MSRSPFRTYPSDSSLHQLPRLRFPPPLSLDALGRARLEARLGKRQELCPRLGPLIFRLVDYKRYMAALAGAVLVMVASALLIPMASIAVATPAGTITEFSTGLNTTNTEGLSASSYPLYIVPGPDGNLWFSDLVGAIGRITTSGAIIEFSAGLNRHSTPEGIVLGPDGNLWFTNRATSSIGRITPSGTITEFSTIPNGCSGFPGTMCSADEIVSGPDGNLWFNFDGSPQSIARITPSGAITKFSLGPDMENGLCCQIVSGPDGNLWFTASDHSIGRITPSGTVTEFTVGLNPASTPEEIMSGPDGNLWFTDRASRGSVPAIGRIAPDGTVTEFAVGLAPNSSPTGLVSGPDGNLWFTDSGARAIGRITPSGTITEFTAGLNPGGYPEGIVSGTDGNLWFTDNGGPPRAIGRITPTGAIAEFSAGLNPGDLAHNLVTGPDGNLWFVDDSNNAKAIGRITTHETPEQALAPAPTPVVAPQAASVSLASTRLVSKGDRVTAIKLTCTGTSKCSGRLVLTAKTRSKGKRKRFTTTTIGTATFSIPSGKTMTVNLELDAAGKALLKTHRGHLTVSLTIFKSSPAPPQTQTESVQLARPKTPSVKKPR